MPGAFRVFQMLSRNGGTVNVTARVVGVEEEGRETVADGAAVPSSNNANGSATNAYLEDELDRLGIPFAGAVEAEPPSIAQPVPPSQCRDEARESTIMMADSRLADAADVDVYDAERIPTVVLCGKKIARSTAALLACLFLLLAAAAIAIAVPTTISSVAEDRETRITEEISTFATGDIEDPTSPHGKALEWMLGASNAEIDVLPATSGNGDLIKQRFSLAVLYYSTGGDSSWMERGNFLSSDHVCEWSRDQVICDEADEVIELNLANNTLQGILPQEIKYFHTLKHLNLTQNPDLNGVLLPAIGELASLETIDFYDSSFNGPIPSSFGNLQNLTHLVLHNNDLTKSGWASAIGSLRNLRYLDLGKNHLYRVPSDSDFFDPMMEINPADEPGFIFDLTLLQYLDLSENMIGNHPTGFHIPKNVGTLTHLRVLNMASNNIRGSLPTELGRTSNLEELMLNDNEFGHSFKYESGVDIEGDSDNANIRGYNTYKGIPTELGKLKELKRLDLSCNDGVGGRIPSTLGNLSKLEYLNMTGVGLRGQIPEELGNLKNLEALLLGENDYLTGAIPTGIFHEKLRLLYLELNELTGTISTEIGKAVGLKEMWLCGNKLEGPIPSEIGNMVGLGQLILYSNGLTSTLPESIGNLVQLVDLDLSANELTGELPTSMGNLINLEYFDAADNSFSGTLPTEIENLTALIKIDGYLIFPGTV